MYRLTPLSARRQSRRPRRGIPAFVPAAAGGRQVASSVASRAPLLGAAVSRVAVDSWRHEPVSTRGRLCFLSFLHSVQFGTSSIQMLCGARPNPPNFYENIAVRKKFVTPLSIYDRRFIYFGGKKAYSTELLIHFTSVFLRQYSGFENFQHSYNLSMKKYSNSKSNGIVVSMFSYH